MARVPKASEIGTVEIASLGGGARSLAAQAGTLIQKRSDATQAAILNIIKLPDHIRKLRKAHAEWLKERDNDGDGNGGPEGESQPDGAGTEDGGDDFAAIHTSSRLGQAESTEPLFSTPPMSAEEVANTAKLAQASKNEASAFVLDLKSKRQRAEDEAFATSVTTKARSVFSQLLSDSQEQISSAPNDSASDFQRRLESESEKLIEAGRTTGGLASPQALRNTRDRLDILAGTFVRQAAVFENNARVGKLTSDLEGGLASLAQEVRRSPERYHALVEAADENLVGATSFLPPQRILSLRSEAQSEIAKAAVEGVLARDPALAQEMLAAGDFGPELTSEVAATASKRAKALIEGGRRDQEREAKLEEAAEASRLAKERAEMERRLSQAIAKGEVGFAEVEDAFAHGQVNETQRNSLSRNILERDAKNLREGDQVRRIANLLAGEGEPLDPGDPADREAVDFYWQEVALPGQEELTDEERLEDTLTFLRKTGVVPSSLLERTRVGLDSEDPQRRAAAARLLDALGQFSREALSVFDDRELALGAIVSKLLGSGENLESALRRADKLVSSLPEELNERRRQMDDLRLREKATNALTMRLGSDVPPRMTEDFVELIEDFYLKTGDLEISRRLATGRLEAIWGNQGVGPTQRFVRRDESEGEVRRLGRFRRDIGDQSEAQIDGSQLPTFSDNPNVKSVFREARIALANGASLSKVQQRIRELGFDEDRLRELGINPSVLGPTVNSEIYPRISTVVTGDGQALVVGEGPGFRDQLGLFGIQEGNVTAAGTRLENFGGNNRFFDLRPEPASPGEIRPQERPPFSERAKDFFTGDLRREFDLPELPDSLFLVDENGEKKLTHIKPLIALLAGPTFNPTDTKILHPDRGVLLARAALVGDALGAEVRFDKFGNAIADFGEGRLFYVNRPGLTKQDVTDSLVALAQEVGSNVATLGFKALFPNVSEIPIVEKLFELGFDFLVGALLGLEDTAKELGSVLEGFTRDGRESLARANPMARKLLLAFMSSSKFFDPKSGRLTEPGGRAIVDAGLDPRQFTPRFIADFKQAAGSLEESENRSRSGGRIKNGRTALVDPKSLEEAASTAKLEGTGIGETGFGQGRVELSEKRNAEFEALRERAGSIQRDNNGEPADGTVRGSVAPGVRRGRGPLIRPDREKQGASKRRKEK